MAGIIDPFAAKPSNEGQDPSEAEHSVFPTPPTHFEPTTVTQDPLELQDYDLSVSSTEKYSIIG
jgi:hypothetical protein